MLTSTHDNFKVFPNTFLGKSLSLAVEAQTIFLSERDLKSPTAWIGLSSSCCGAYQEPGLLRFSNYSHDKPQHRKVSASCFVLPNTVGWKLETRHLRKMGFYSPQRRTKQINDTVATTQIPMSPS